MSDERFDDAILSAARHGHADVLQERLSTLDNPAVYVNRKFDYERGQKCTLLAVACLNNHEHIVRILLEHFQADFATLSDVIIADSKLNGQVCVNVPVLWTAASIDNFKLVRLLVEHGAPVNQTTQTNSTALRAACYNGNVDMARYLVAHGADVSIAKERNDTNLMVSVYHKRFRMVVYLVDELHYDVNERDADGRSALYDAVNCGSLHLVEYLLAHGAENFRATVDGMSPLMWAAERRRDDLIEAIAPHCSPLERIEAEELIASAFVCSRRNDRDLHLAYEHFRRALELRDTLKLPKCRRTDTHEIFGDQQECQTIEDLQRIQSNLDGLYDEALLVRERILGAENSEYRYSLCFRGATLFDDEQYEAGTRYWIYELRICRERSIALDPKHLRNFACLFSEMLQQLDSVPMHSLLPVLSATINELEQRNEKFDFNLHTTLFLITIASQFIAKSDTLPSVFTPFYRLVRSLNRQRLTNIESGMSLLHLSVDHNTKTNDRVLEYTCKYPCRETARTLLRCGADVNALNNRHETALHLLVAGKSTCDETLFGLLCNAGVHFDYANASGQSPMDVATDATAKQLLRSKTKLSLKCLCARLIRKTDVPFHEKIPSSLVCFVEKH